MQKSCLKMFCCGLLIYSKTFPNNSSACVFKSTCLSYVMCSAKVRTPQAVDYLSELLASAPCG